MLNFNIFLSFCSKFQNHFYPIIYIVLLPTKLINQTSSSLPKSSIKIQNWNLWLHLSHVSKLIPKLFSNTVWIQHPTSSQQLIHLTTLSSTSHFTILSTRISWKAVRIMMKSIYLKNSVKLEVYQNRDWG